LTEGIAEIRFALSNGVTRLAHLYQRDPLRVLFPAPAENDPPLAVIVTTSGGLVAGDRLDVDVGLAPGAVAHVTTSAAEKIYRSTGQTTTISQNLSVEPGAVLEFLPFEAILFDEARLRRKTVLDLAPGAAFLGGEIVVFGRRARGERLANGFLHEIWEVRNGGTLVWGDALHLEGDIASIIDDPACFDRAAAFATMILVTPKQILPQLVEDAQRLLSARSNQRVRSGVTAVGEVLVARWLGADAAQLREAYARLACQFRSAALGWPPRLPRVWYV
jgi:urease accessory protein